MRVEESVVGAVALQREAADEVEAALSERARGEPSVSIDLLLQALDRERASLDLLEVGVETIQRSLDRRRRSIEQQAEVLSQLAECLNKKGGSDATRGQVEVHRQTETQS